MTQMKRLMILAALGLAPAAAFADGVTGTVTGPRGGTADFVASCKATADGYACTRESILTGPNGNVGTRDILREGTLESVTRTSTFEGPNGRTVTTIRERKRN